MIQTKLSSILDIVVVIEGMVVVVEGIVVVVEGIVVVVEGIGVVVEGLVVMVEVIVVVVFEVVSPSASPVRRGGHLLPILSLPLLLVLVLHSGGPGLRGRCCLKQSSSP